MSRNYRKVPNPQWRHRYPGEILDITGERYGRLVALQFTRSNDIGQSYWLFQCDCGDITEKRAISVRCGQTHSCGCLRKRKPVAIAPSRALPVQAWQLESESVEQIEEHW